jgi:hypothetical protein
MKLKSSRVCIEIMAQITKMNDSTVSFVRSSICSIFCPLSGFDKRQKMLAIMGSEMTVCSVPTLQWTYRS